MSDNLNPNNKISVRMRVASFFSVVTLLVADQVIKHFIDIKLKGSSPVVLIDNILQLNYIENDGAMMGFMSGKTEILTVFAIICVIALVFVIVTGKIKDYIDYWCVILMVTGGLGNIIDRVFRGYVIDYIEVLFVDFYIFNFADCLITVAAFVLIFYQFYLIYIESKRKKTTGEADD